MKYTHIAHARVDTFVVSFNPMVHTRGMSDTGKTRVLTLLLTLMLYACQHK